MKHKIVEQAVRWLEKMGIEVEHNEELQQFEFEYKGAFMIIHTDTPEGVLSFTCPYVFPDEVSNENKTIFEKAKEWWTKHIDTMARLREAIHLRSYANVNPLQDYVNEGYSLFKECLELASVDAVLNLVNIEPKPVIQQEQPEEEVEE